MLRRGLTLLRATFSSARHQERIRAQPNVKHGEGDRNPPLDVRQRNILVFDWLVFLLSVVPADEPFVTEQRDGINSGSVLNSQALPASNPTASKNPDAPLDTAR
jgi:hypothetical protein